MEKITDSAKSLLLIDESFNFDKLNFFNTKETRIITFDNLSHKLLETQNIEHVTSDSFLFENDYHEIQEKSYELQQWYDLEEIKPFLLFENINLGQLTYVDTVYFITKSLKKFIEIFKIYEKYPKTHFITTTHLSKILDYFTKSYEDIGEKIQSPRYHENIHHDLKLGNFNIGLNISFEKYTQIKNFVEKLFSSFFNPKNVPDNKKSTLLIEFDPVKYKTLLLESSSSSVNFILYNRRRPTIWNVDSFNILKKSGTKIVSENKIIDKKLINDCEEKTKFHEQKISLLFNKQLVSKKFEFKEKNLWPLFQNIFIKTVLDNVKNKILEILLAKKVLNTYDISSIIIHSENSSTENILVNVAKTKNIPILLLQHGIIYDSKNSILRNDLVGVYPNQSDYALVWGPLMKKHLITLGYDENKIKDLGCPLYDNMQSQILNSKKTILVTTSPPMNDFAIDLSVKTNQNYENAIKKICHFCKNNNVNLIFKLHPSLEENIQELIKTNYTNAKIVSSGNVIPLIKQCSLMITFDLSTTILESQLLSKPVISISFRDSNKLNSIIFENACTRISVEDIEDIIPKILSDDDFYNELIEKGRIFSKSYISHQNVSSSSLLNFLAQI